MMNDTMNTTSTTTQNYVDRYDDEDDGYPTDEHTINSWAQSRGEDAQRLHSLAQRLHFLHNRLAAMAEDVDADDSSFLVNVQAEDIEIAPTDSLPRVNDCDDDFLADAQVEDVDVEQQSVGSSVLVGARFVDSPTIGRRTYYDMYASTLSKADSTHAATLEDFVAKDSNMVGRDDNQSIATYSYGRAYVDRDTNCTSNFSALTEEYCYDARKVGMFEAIKASIIHEVESHGDGSNGYHSGVVDSPPRSVATTAPESDHSLVESLPAPPPLRQSSQADELARDCLAAIGHAGKSEIMVQDIDTDVSSFLENVQVSTLEYLNLRESPMVGRDENQSIGTYSYGRAYIDNATLGESTNFSALTDDYCYDARKVGMSEAIKPNIIREGVSHGGGSKGYHSGVVDSPPRAAVATTAPESNHSYVESLPAPPPPRQSPSQAGDFTVYKNVENIERIGYVDEESATRHEATNEGNCSWFTSSSPCVKLVVLISMLMLLGSLARLALTF